MTSELDVTDAPPPETDGPEHRLPRPDDERRREGAPRVILPSLIGPRKTRGGRKPSGKRRRMSVLDLTESGR